MSDIASYLVEPCTMPFCKGCGHSHVVRVLNESLIRLHISPSDVCLVTDIGCIGLADALFKTVHTVHTTHGRSSAFATGIQIADIVLAEGKLKTIVLIGDGGAMIGLQHLVNAALMNVDITVVLCNNFLFGMTGGQNSGFSPFDFVTPTTPRGNIVPPLDICRVMAACGAEFIARVVATDRELEPTITAALEHPGFSLVEVVELCTEHAVEQNALTGKALARIIEGNGQELGRIRQTRTRSEFSERYADKYPGSTAPSLSDAKYAAMRSRSDLSKQVGIVIAGSAGEKVQSSARRLCEGAMESGLRCTQKNDNPVTQGSGFSIAEVILSPNEIFYTGIDSPDCVIVVSHDGLSELIEKRVLDQLSPESLLIIDSELGGVTTRARVQAHPFRKEHGASNAAGRAIEFYLRLSNTYPPELFHVT